MENVQVADTKTQLDVKNACIDGSTFNCVSIANASFYDVNMCGIKISNANLSDLEIEGAGLGGAYIHNIGTPPEGHPMYNPDATMKPIKLEDCYLAGSLIINCNLSGVEISDCNVTGMKINGILLDDLLQAYQKKQ